MDDQRLPILDFSSTDRLHNARLLTEAMETVGFVYCDNVPGYNISEVETRLHQAAEWLPIDKSYVSPLENGMTRPSVCTGAMCPSSLAGQTLSRGGRVWYRRVHGVVLATGSCRVQSDRCIFPRDK